MDILLLAITVVSLVVAIFMSVIAWRLSREERALSAARIAALAAAASETQPTVVPAVSAAPVPPPPPVPAAPTRVAAPTEPAEKVEITEPRLSPWPPPAGWRRQATPQPADDVARVDAVATPRVAPREPASEAHVQPFLRTAAHSDSIGDGFLSATHPSGGPQRGLAIAAAFLFVLVVTGGYFTIYGSDDVGGVTTPASEAARSPLELLSLRHERNKGHLAITGLVRNPAGGQHVEKLAAVVFLFDQQGSFITSSRAGVDFTQLSPGDESPFVIRIDAAPTNVARYRVSFRTDAGVIPHVDRRGQEPIAGSLP